MTAAEAPDECRGRKAFCANYYGARWKEEIPYLDACFQALADAVDYAEHTVSDSEIPSDGLLLVQISGKTMDDAEIDHVTAIGTFNSEVGWSIIDMDIMDFVVHKWRTIPQWED